LRQLQTDYESFNSQIKLIENLMSSIHATEMHKNVEHIAAVQKKVEWLEVAFVSFYAAEFTHIILELSHEKEGNPLFGMAVITSIAILSGLLALIRLDLVKYFKK